MPFNRLGGLIALLLIGAVNGCGADASGPPWLTEPPNLSIQAGDNQSAMPAMLLPKQLIVRATTTNGAFVAGYPVEWTVVEGGGKVEATESTTDFAGYSYAHWTLGAASGPQQVKVTVSFKTADGTGSSVSTLFSAMALSPPRPKPAILHYNGTSWSVSMETAADVPAANLNSIWGSSRSAIFAVGQRGFPPAPLIVRYDGTAWSVPPYHLDFDDRRPELPSVSGSSGFNIFTLASDLYPTTVGTSVFRFDGSTWSFQYIRRCGGPLSPSCPPLLNAVWTDSPTNVVAVGDQGFIVRYNGTAWTEDAPITTNNLRAVWGVPSATPARIFAVGDAGTIIVFDGNVWQTQASGTTETLYGVWGTSANDVFAVGGAAGTGVILHYDGTSWSSQHSSGPALHGVWGATGSSVFAVGDGPTILYYDGSSWTPQTATAAIDLRGVWGSSPRDVFAVGHAR